MGWSANKVRFKRIDMCSIEKSIFCYFIIRIKKNGLKVRMGHGTCPRVPKEKEMFHVKHLLLFKQKSYSGLLAGIPGFLGYFFEICLTL